VDVNPSEFGTVGSHHAQGRFALRQCLAAAVADERIQIDPASAGRSGLVRLTGGRPGRDIHRRAVREAPNGRVGREPSSPDNGTSRRRSAQRSHSAHRKPSADQPIPATKRAARPAPHCQSRSRSVVLSNRYHCLHKDLTPPLDHLSQLNPSGRPQYLRRAT
jgi:hypothetical protein